MRLLSRLGARARDLAIRFVTRASEGWSYLAGRQARDARLVGNGDSSSIVQSAIGWIQRNFPEAPVRVRLRDAKGELANATSDGATALLELLRFPNAFYSGVLLWMATVADFWISGNGYWLKVRDESTGGRVVALWWIPSTLMAPKWSEDGSDFVRHYLYTPAPEVEIKLRPEDVVHFRWGFDPENIRLGRSPLRTVLREIYTDEEAASYTSTILRNLGVPGVVISPGADDVDLEEEDATAIKEQFKAQFGGDRRGEPMVVGAKAQVSILSFSPEQMNLKDLRRVPEERVSGVLGVPAIVAGLGAGLDRSTFANYAEAREAGYEENIIPTHRLLGADLEIQLLSDFVPNPRDHVVDFDVSDVRVLQEDENKIWLRLGDAASKGLILLSDFNRGVGLPVDEKLHDVYLRDARIVAVKKDAPEAIGEAPPEPEIVDQGGAGGPGDPEEPEEDQQPPTSIPDRLAASLEGLERGLERRDGELGRLLASTVEAVGARPIELHAETRLEPGAVVVTMPEPATNGKHRSKGRTTTFVFDDDGKITGKREVEE